MYTNVKIKIYNNKLILTPFTRLNLRFHCIGFMNVNSETSLTALSNNN